jgi:hypothetical protein
LSQIFVKQNLPEAWRLIIVARQYVTIDRFAMLGDTLTACKATADRVFDADLDPDVAVREDTLCFLAAVWNQCVLLLAKAKADQRIRVEEDPHKVPEISIPDYAAMRERFRVDRRDLPLRAAIEPNKNTIERMIRDHTVKVMLQFCELSEIRLRSEKITYKSGVAENADALLKLAKVMQHADVISHEDVMNRIMAFQIGLEYTGRCPYRTNAYTQGGATGGLLAYLIMQFRETTGHDPMWFTLIVERKIRGMIAKLCFDRYSKYNTYGSAMEEVLANRMFLWSDARSEFQRGDQGRRRDRTPDRGASADEDKFAGNANLDDPPSADRKERNKARAEKKKANVKRQKEELKQLRLDQGAAAGRGQQQLPPRPVNGRPTIQRAAGAQKEMAPKEVWDAVKALKKTFKKRCEFWNTQAGCRFDNGTCTSSSSAIGRMAARRAEARPGQDVVLLLCRRKRFGLGRGTLCRISPRSG